MKGLPVLVALALFASPSVSYFQHQRPVQISAAGQQYIVVDESIWQHARPDLGDLRLYAGETEIPYALVTEHGSQQREHTAVPVLQQSTVAGKTQFLIDMSGLNEYDHVKLKLSARNFVAHALVEGSDDLHGKQWASLGDNILYDLSSDNLGSNAMLRLPRATYKYLRVTIDGPVAPKDILGATSETGIEEAALWRDVSSAPQQQQDSQKNTVLTFDVAEKVPAERVLFAIDPAQPNFQRRVEIQNEKSAWLGSGEINRIHMVRAGQKIDSENQEVAFSAVAQKVVKVTIHNGDDPPLKLTGARLQQLERRIYFEASGQNQLTLYYGDEKLDRPVYDYAKLFQQDKSAAPAKLEADASNPAYTGRPDDRPWSERHPAAMWAAIIAAVVILGAVALRSIRSTAA
jgi:Protein of unknown function (DUF3999)